MSLEGIVDALGDMVENGQLSEMATYSTFYKLGEATFFMDWAVDSGCLKCAVFFVGLNEDRLKYRWKIKICFPSEMDGELVASGIPLPCQVMDEKYDIVGSTQHAVFVAPPTTLSAAMRPFLGLDGNGALKFQLEFLHAQ